MSWPGASNAVRDNAQFAEADGPPGSFVALEVSRGHRRRTLIDDDLEFGWVQQRVMDQAFLHCPNQSLPMPVLARSPRIELHVKRGEAGRLGGLFGANSYGKPFDGKRPRAQVFACVVSGARAK